MAVADTFDALTSNRSYHRARSLEEAINILVDSSGYDYAPDVVKGMVAWIENVRNQLGQTQLSIEQLLDSQKKLDDSSISPLITCEVFN